MKSIITQAGTAMLVLVLFIGCTGRKNNDKNRKLAIEQSGCQMPPPTGLPAAIRKYVYPNCLTTMERLGKWTGNASTVIPNNQAPDAYFSAVSPSGIAAGETVYIVVHGWAPGYRDSVDRHPTLKWWENAARDKTGALASTWAWSGVSSGNTQISPNGLIQEIQRFENTQNRVNPTVLAYSWIDQSATPLGSVFDYLYVYLSESYTTINGIRLAKAITEAVTPGFWIDPKSKLIIMGHSHGSKVATVATSMLQKFKADVTKLVIMDSPETGYYLSTAGTFSPLRTNSANLLAPYFSPGNIAVNPPNTQLATGYTYVFNNLSYFGTVYSNFPMLRNMAQISLKPDKLYGISEVAEKHAYAAAWEAGAAYATQNRQGLGWPPFNYLPPFNLQQSWRSNNQWDLVPGTADKPFQYSLQSVDLSLKRQKGCMNAVTTDSIILGCNQDAVSHMKGYYYVFNSSIWGLSFRLRFSDPQPGDFLVVTASTPPFSGMNGWDEQILAGVYDGGSFQKTMDKDVLVTINTNNKTWTNVNFYYIRSESHKTGSVTILDPKNVYITVN